MVVVVVVVVVVVTEPGNATIGLHHAKHNGHTVPQTSVESFHSASQPLDVTVHH